MKFATKALIGLGILAVGALYLKAKFDAAVDAYPDDFEFDKSLDDCYTELKSNRSWAETVTMNTRSSGNPDFTLEAFYECLKLFFMKLQNEGETTKSPKDAMSHFARWLKFELNNKKDGKSKRTNTNPETDVEVRTIKL